MTGTLKKSSSAAVTVGGNGADDERINRSEQLLIILRLASVRFRIA